ncbi:unnamed protein product [Amoebophrya sp. A120]|nr:unnamed protein product [Amoebophrya sp. A120]|eukprot:GSA120T00019031001.1
MDCVWEDEVSESAFVVRAAAAVLRNDVAAKELAVMEGASTPIHSSSCSFGPSSVGGPRASSHQQTVQIDPDRLAAHGYVKTRMHAHTEKTLHGLLAAELKYMGGGGPQQEIKEVGRSTVDATTKSSSAAGSAPGPDGGHQEHLQAASSHSWEDDERPRF